MSGLSDYQRDRLLDHMLGAIADVADVTLYAALCKTVPTADLTGTTIDEADYTGYARVAITSNQTNWPAAVNGVMANGVEIAFPTCTGGDHTVLAVAFCTAATLGNMIFWATIPTTPIYSGDVPNFAVGDLDITLS